MTGTITYRGGAVVANVHAVPVFWTANVDPAIQAWAQGYLAALADSSHLDLLAELNKAHGLNHPGENELDARIENFELAARMQLAAPEVSVEPSRVSV